ncbi:hypothetical protein GBAR_LOCUS11247 [Geodia barretti]|uniref:Uncharacterized protein n=1 Tax=Geodia barretti TaxID=519541 RepID=A0AA35RXT0_GEOBA|nr:hypothetical protein GBAR_LOCUS11247 [Geodia barretti]
MQVLRLGMSDSFEKISVHPLRYRPSTLLFGVVPGSFQFPGALGLYQCPGELI